MESAFLKSSRMKPLSPVRDICNSHYDNAKKVTLSSPLLNFCWLRATAAPLAGRLDQGTLLKTYEYKLRLADHPQYSNQSNSFESLHESRTANHHSQSWLAPKPPINQNLRSTIPNSKHHN
ncbi:hypothetical protein M758_UG147700 [Ceratodon purpureus]|nr:hypothetical protein M758_UG147700 [Ceratodon purpureus]